MLTINYRLVALVRTKIENNRGEKMKEKLRNWHDGLMILLLTIVGGVAGAVVVSLPVTVIGELLEMEINLYISASIGAFVFGPYFTYHSSVQITENL